MKPRSRRLLAPAVVLASLSCVCPSAHGQQGFGEALRRARGLLGEGREREAAIEAEAASSAADALEAFLVAETLRALAGGLAQARSSVPSASSLERLAPDLQVAHIDHMAAAVEAWRMRLVLPAEAAAGLAALNARSPWELHNIEAFRTGLALAVEAEAFVPRAIDLPVAIVPDLDAELEAMLAGVDRKIVEGGMRLRRGRRAHLDPTTRLNALGDLDVAVAGSMAVSDVIMGQERFGGVDFANYMQGTGFQVVASSPRRVSSGWDTGPDLIAQAAAANAERFRALQQQAAVNEQAASAGSVPAGGGGGGMPPCSYNGPVDPPAHLSQGASGMGMADKYRKAAEACEWAASKYDSVGCPEAAAWCRREAKRYRDVVASLRSR